MADVVAQTVPDQQWTPVDGCAGVWVYQHTGQPQSLILTPDGRITSPAGPIWDIRLDPVIWRTGATTMTAHHAKDPATVRDALKDARGETGA